ncbi:hypothetical protein Cni_G13025 [Canna indica]|uniref:Pectin acetylesterase n=1 Tax=Canna indica TaxID=4628 RepID=A0AAQ3QB56_9LILI|nr:hypothetical protein Cni_G13025 [Canna indica]
MFGAKSGAWIHLFVCLIYLLSLLEVDGGPVPMTLLSNAAAKGALCLDGSSPAYHFSPGSGSGANNWLVHMEGGGWCRNTEECVERKGNFRGSSKYMKPLSFSGILGSIKSSNPDFYNWNRIKIRYCDGSSFTGDIDKVDPATNLHYRGARIFSAIIAELLAKGMNKAQNVCSCKWLRLINNNAKFYPNIAKRWQALLSGCSAGGLASILHCDNFRSLLPATAKVKCFADAGYFIDAKDISGADSVKSLYADVVNTHGSAKNLPASCTSRFPASMCFFPQYVVPTMRTPLFILNAAYDAWQIRNILVPSSADRKKAWAACKEDIKKCSSPQLQTLQGYKSQFLRALPSAGNSSVGMFILSCHAHCQSGSKDIWLAPNSPMIDKIPIGKAVGDWFFDRNVPRKIDCPYPCNSSCRNVSDED